MAGSVVPRRDPLTEVLLRPTAQVAVHAGSAQSLAPSTRSLGAMARSRAAILDGARKAVLVSGTRITMAQVAAAAGVAKATLYNHFRTRDEVLSALLGDEIDRAIEQISHLEVHEALRRAATLASDHPLLEALGNEPEVLAALSRVDVRTAGWCRIAEAVDALLASRGLRGTPTILRWLSSFVLSPADPLDIAFDIDVLVAGLPPRP